MAFAKNTFTGNTESNVEPLNENFEEIYREIELFPGVNGRLAEKGVGTDAIAAGTVTAEKLSGDLLKVSTGTLTDSDVVIPSTKLVKETVQAVPGTAVIPPLGAHYQYNGGSFWGGGITTDAFHRAVCPDFQAGYSGNYIGNYEFELSEGWYYFYGRVNRRIWGTATTNWGPYLNFGDSDARWAEKFRYPNGYRSVYTGGSSSSTYGRDDSMETMFHADEGDKLSMGLSFSGPNGVYWYYQPTNFRFFKIDRADI